MTDYVLTKTAEADLREIFDYIATSESLDRALHLHKKFVSAFKAWHRIRGWEPKEI